MEHVFVSYNLKPGVGRDEYVHFSRELDQVITASQPGVLSFDVHLLEGGSDGDGIDTTPPVDVVETLDVASWEAWKRVVTSAPMAPVREAFANVVDTASVQMWRATAV